MMVFDGPGLARKVVRNVAWYDYTPPPGAPLAGLKAFDNWRKSTYDVGRKVQRSIFLTGRRRNAKSRIRHALLHPKP